MSSAAIADIRHTVETIERHVAGLEGRIGAVLGQLHSHDSRITKVTDLMQTVLKFNTAQIDELRRSLDSTDEHLRSVREVLRVSTEQNGRVLRELAELRK